MGFGCMSGPLGLEDLAAVHRVPALPPSRHDQAARRFPTCRCSAARRGPGSTSRSTRRSCSRCCARSCSPRSRPRTCIPIVVLLPLCGLGDKTIFLARARRAPLRDDRLLPVRRELDRRLQVGAARDLVLGRRLEAHGRVRLRRADHDRQQPAAEERRAAASGSSSPTPTTCTPSPLAKAMAHAGTFLEFAHAAHPAVRHPRGPAPATSACSSLLMLHGFILSNLPIAAVFEWNVLSIYAAFFLFVGHPEVSLFAVGSRAAHALPARRAARPAADRQPGAVEGLVPGGDALLRRQLGVERVAVPQRQLPQARPR